MIEIILVIALGLGTLCGALALIKLKGELRHARLRLSSLERIITKCTGGYTSLAGRLDCMMWRIKDTESVALGTVSRMDQKLNNIRIQPANVYTAGIPDEIEKRIVELEAKANEVTVVIS